jgi:hypothetical protein
MVFKGGQYPTLVAIIGASSPRFRISAVHMSRSVLCWVIIHNTYFWSKLLIWRTLATMMQWHSNLKHYMTVNLARTLPVTEHFPTQHLEDDLLEYIRYTGRLERELQVQEVFVNLAIGMWG